MLSIIIPSYKDPFLQRTIDDILENAEGEIEIIAVIDGYTLDKPLKEDPRVHVVTHHINKGMRASINSGVAASKGEYIMKTDAHCCFDKGFDVKLLSRIEDNWVVSPRRYKLDIEKWQVTDDPPVDYEWLFTDRPDKIGGAPWTRRRINRKDIPIDENMVFQGSCYVMSRRHWNWLGGLHEEGYGTFIQEPVEVCLKTWLGGGKVMVNKNTWYAHRHRKFPRTYQGNRKEIEAGNKYSMEYWLSNRWEKRVHDIEWLLRRFGLSFKKYNPDKQL